MALVVTISGSPSAISRTAALARHVRERLERLGLEVGGIDVRDLPAADLIQGRADAAALRGPIALVERAAGVVVLTPIYKASFSGVLKTFLDLLPQYALANKVALPLATGGSLAHVLSIDYALRPVLVALGARHVVSGLFLLDRWLGRDDATELVVDPEIEGRLAAILADFAASVRASVDLTTATSAAMRAAG